MADSPEERHTVPPPGPSNGSPAPRVKAVDARRHSSFESMAAPTP